MAQSGPELAGRRGFREQFEREWLYGGFLAACLRITGSFSGYILIQQALGSSGRGVHVADMEDLDGSLPQACCF